MRRSELQESIIQKVLLTNNAQLLNYLNYLLSNKKERETHMEPDFESSILSEKQSDYSSGKTLSDDDVFRRNG